MGDMLVKAGDWQTAQAIYRDAMASKEYKNWEFQYVLDECGTVRSSSVIARA
jgi:hypothetical protein